MLYSKSGGRLVFVVDKGSFPQNSICDVVDEVYSTIKTRQVVKAAKQEVAFNKLIQELAEPTCEIKQHYLDEDLIHDDTFYLEMAAFEFQDTDFLVPTNQLLQKTDPDHFIAIFGSSFGTTETPKQFPGVTADDFRGLMKYLYPLDVNNSADELTIDDWVAILKLSTKWRMFTLRDEAIKKLNNNSDGLSPIMKVQLGKECKITEWVWSGYVALVEREEYFTEADVIAIGLDSVTKLCEVREQGYAGEWDIYCNRLTLEAHGTSNLITDRISQISVVDHLDHDDDNLVMAILDAQSLGNRRLMLDAWGRMARRLESLKLEEVESLTLGIALMMWEVRLETRRAAWSLVQEYGAKCNAKALHVSQRIASAFASELQYIENQAISFALSKFGLNKGKQPEVRAEEDTDEEEEEIPDSALEPVPDLETMFTESLALRKRIKDLEQKSNENVNTTLGRQLRRDLRRSRLSAQNWYTSAAGYNEPASTLNLSTVNWLTVHPTLKRMATKLILNNAGKLSLDGRGIGPKKWKSMRSKILAFSTCNDLEIQIDEDSQVINLILPVSES